MKYIKTKDMMKRGRDIYDYILSREVLASAFKYIVLNNKSNNAPYHHFHHMMTVTKWVYLGSGQYPAKMTSEISTSLVISAMFHDMNHSMGELPDSENVKNAITAFNKWYTSFVKPPEFVNPKMVEENIKATEYPYVVNTVNMTLSQKIIRDADLMVALEPDWFQNIMLGLTKEFKSDNVSKTIQGNIEFHKNIKMCTSWGENLYKKHWADFIETLLDLEILFKKD